MDLLTLFYSLVTASVVASVLAAGIWLLGRWGAALIPPTWSHALWWVFVARLVYPIAEVLVMVVAMGWAPNLPVLAPGQVLAAPPSVGGGTGPEGGHLLPTPPTTTSGSLFAPLVLPREVGSSLAALWFVGMGVGLLVLTMGAFRMRGLLVRGKEPREGLVHQRFEACRQRLLPRSRVRLVVISQISGPAVYGPFRPVVCLPEYLARSLDASALDHVFEHELTHLRRGDLFFTTLLLCLRAVYWFNPLIWLACRRVDALRELACDEAVIGARSDEERRAYGHTLLSVAARSGTHRGVWLAPGLTRRKQEIGERILFIGRPVRGRRMGAWLALAGLVFALSASLVQTTPLLSASRRTFLPAVRVEGGAFNAEGHRVTMSSFYMGQTEVTQEQFQRLMGRNPSWFSRDADAPRRPVEQITWFDAVEFCNRLSEKDGLEPVYTIEGKSVIAQVDRNGWRLPTEAEWHYSARGGATTRGFEWAGSDRIDEVAWYGRNSGSRSQPVATKAPNELGLYDMSGNTAEWCNDLAGAYPSGDKDPQGATSGWERSLCGGSFTSSAYMASLVDRGSSDPWLRSNQIGFRVARRDS